MNSKSEIRHTAYKWKKIQVCRDVMMSFTIL